MSTIRVTGIGGYVQASRRPRGVALVAAAKLRPAAHSSPCRQCQRRAPHLLPPQPAGLPQATTRPPIPPPRCTSKPWVLHQRGGRRQQPRIGQSSQSTEMAAFIIEHAATPASRRLPWREAPPWRPPVPSGLYQAARRGQRPCCCRSCARLQRAEGVAVADMGEGRRRKGLGIEFQSTSSR